MKTVKLTVVGLACAEEVRLLKETVGILDGVGLLDFSLFAGIMTVSVRSGQGR
jgi:copper chaperone CopZ